MKTNTLLRIALAGTAALLTHTTFAQSWETVDDFGHNPGFPAQAHTAVVDAQGNLFVGGQAGDGTRTHALIERSSDQGATWTTIEDYVDSTNWLTTFNAIGFDAAHNIYTVGEGTGSADYHLFVRKSADGGATWSTIAQVPYNNPFMTPGNPCFAVDSLGRLYVVAGANPALLLRSSNGGATWTTGHPFSDGSTTKGIVSTSAGVFVAGSLAGPWGTVRKSTDGGKTWVTVDNYYGGGSGFQGQLQSICADAQGNVYVGGFANITTGRGKQAVTTSNWLIRKGTNGGTRWQTIAKFPVRSYVPNLVNPLYASALYNPVNALSFDAFGNMFVAGGITGSDWVVLKSADQGVTWSVADAVADANQYTGGNAWVIATDAVGGVYVAGYLGYSSATDAHGQHWVVRKQVGP